MEEQTLNQEQNQQESGNILPALIDMSDVTIGGYGKLPEKGEAPPSLMIRRARALDRKYRFLKIMSENKANVKIACQLTKTARSTFNTWMRRDADFNNAVVMIEEEVIDHVEDKLHKKIDSGDTAAILFFLKCKAKHRGYIEKENNINILNVNQTVREMSDDQLRDAADDLRARIAAASGDSAEAM